MDVRAIKREEIKKKKPCSLILNVCCKVRLFLRLRFGINNFSTSGFYNIRCSKEKKKNTHVDDRLNVNNNYSFFILERPRK